MSNKRLMTIFGLLLVFSLILTSCKSAQPATPAATVAVTEEPAATTRKGGWLDEIDFSVVSNDSAVTQIQAGAINMYADGLAAADLQEILDAGLPYVMNNGLQYDILYNPGVCTDTSKLNPFADPKIREATNWLYDRNYINQEIYAGANLLKWFPITTQFPMYANVADVAAKLETIYAYNFDKAAQIIDEQMTALGATKDASGKWTYNGALVTLDFLIRNDSDGTRKPIGDYVASQLESIGFTVNRQYKTSTEAGPIWQTSNPADCQWSLYTAAWSATIIDREEKNIFQQYYTPETSQGVEPLISATPSEEFDTLANNLANGNYSTLEERNSLVADAMELALQDSLQVWLIDGKVFIPFSNDVQVSYDLAAGVQGAQVWPFTIRYKDTEGGIMKIGEQDMFGQPYNPIGGSNWAYDQMAIRATSSGGTMNDPYTGLVWPLNLESATVTVQEGIPVSKTLDWVTLDFAPTIDVPADAYVDWDAKTQTFITAGDKFPEGSTAKVRSVAVYPADLFEKVTWHDGNHLDVADFMMGMILTFERGNPDSALYDEQYVPYYTSFMNSFKGFRITSTDPLTVEFYSDVLSADAELDVYTLWPGPSAAWFSPYAFGEGAWDVLTISNLAEASNELAYTTDKSTLNEVEWTNFVGGPSLEILAKYLDQAIAEQYVPYEATLGQYITPEYAVERYTNLKTWYTEHNSFWIGTGPYYIDRAYMTEKTLTLKHFDAYPDSADRWSSFGSPKIAAVNIDGPAQVTIGDSAEFTVNVSFEGAAYPTDEVKSVKFLIFDANNNIVATEDAEYVADGQYKVTLSSDITSALTTGSNKLTVSVVVIPVAIPTFTSVNFVTLAP
jgi:peptide/nickel transport system substrate-binding protein